MTTREEMVKAADDARAAWEVAYAARDGVAAHAAVWVIWNDARKALIAYNEVNTK